MQIYSYARFARFIHGTDIKTATHDNKVQNRAHHFKGYFILKSGYHSCF